MVEAPDKNRRAEPRRGSDLLAFVVLPNGERRPAKVVDLSTAGCKLQLERAGELPETFDLEMRDRSYRCERRWAQPSSVGVQFVETVSRVLRKAAVA